MGNGDGVVVRVAFGGRDVEADVRDETAEAMLVGWRNEMLARNLAFSTIEQRERIVRRFTDDVGEFPWAWTSGMFDEWLGDRRAVDGYAKTSVRSMALAIRMFCRYLVDPSYDWQRYCEERFGTYPVQICHEWNTATHVQSAESARGLRPFTVDELQSFFDAADDMVASARQSGRKGWVTMLRDSVAFKVAYAWGLRINEVRMLDLGDFGRNPHAPEFGQRGVLRVRHGKAMRGSAPKQRSVLTVFGWAVDCVDEWVSDGRPRIASVGATPMWPTERDGRMRANNLSARFRDVRDEAGIDDSVTFHSLRRSYVTHLIEDGFDARFVQEQVGHEHASTTSIYTAVSSDFRVRSLRRSLDELNDTLLNIGAREDDR